MGWLDIFWGLAQVEQGEENIMRVYGREMASRKQAVSFGFCQVGIVFPLLFLTVSLLTCCDGDT